MEYRTSNRLMSVWIAAMLIPLTLRGDTLELKTGERLEGTVRQAVASGVLIEIAGQPITIPMAKVQAIYFGPRAPQAVEPSLLNEAVDALKALRSVVGSTVSYRDFAPRVLDTKIKVDKYLGGSPHDPLERRAAVGRAMREFELASRAWDGSFPGHEDLSGWQTIETNLDSELVAKCPVVTAVVKRVQLAAAYQGLGMRDSAMVNGELAYMALLKCAVKEVAEIEQNSTSNARPNDLGADLDAKKPAISLSVAPTSAKPSALDPSKPRIVGLDPQ